MRANLGRDETMGGKDPGEFLPLTHLSYQILVALADQDRHGYGIIKEIEATTGGGTAPSTGALYLALQRMVAEGLVTEAPARAAEDDDPRRKYYRLTALGRRVAVAESRRLAELVAFAAGKRLVRGDHG